MIDQNIVLLIWIIFSCVAGAIAKKKGNSVALAVLISILLSPLIGIIVALVQKPNQAAIEKDQLQTGSLKKCPFCAELIKQEARVCRYCGRDLNPRTGASVVTEKEIDELWRESGITRAAPSESGPSVATEEQIEKLWRKSGIASVTPSKAQSVQHEPEFYLLQGSKITGPFNKQRLLEWRKSGIIGDDDLVRSERVEGWTRLEAMTDLKINIKEPEK